MDKFELTEEQKRFVERAQRAFDARLALPPTKCSLRQLQKYNSEMGIEVPDEYRLNETRRGKLSWMRDRYKRLAKLGTIALLGVAIIAVVVFALK